MRVAESSSRARPKCCAARAPRCACRVLHTSMSSPPALCRLGDFPLSRAQILTELHKFMASEAYMRRPGDALNAGGTRMFHGFALWLTVRLLKPRHIIESGAFKGLGTWLLREAAPQAQIIVLSPALPSLYVDRHPDSLYFTGRQFTDFSAVNWECLALDRERTLVFFDDHQSGYRRILEAHARGFRHLLFDDNYPHPDVGDNFSPKMACGARELAARLAPEHRTLPFHDFRFSPAPPRLRVGARELSQIHASFARAVSIYRELPPLWAGPNRFRYSADAFRGASEPPLLPNASALWMRSRARPRRLHPAARAPDDESRAYTFIAYVRLDVTAPTAALHWPRGLANWSAPLRAPRALAPAQCTELRRRARPTRHKGQERDPLMDGLSGAASGAWGWARRLVRGNGRSRKGSDPIK